MSWFSAARAGRNAAPVLQSLGSVPKRSLRPGRWAGCSVEALEQRRLLSVTGSVSGDGDVDEGSPYTLSLSASSDGGTITGWSINWGDDTGTQWLNGDASEAVHYYADGDAHFQIDATVYDYTASYSGSGSYSYSSYSTGTGVDVANVDPEFTVWGAEEALVDQTHYVTRSSVYDPGQDTITQWTVNWGDGTTTTHEPHEGVFGHTYTSTGSYNIDVAAVDEDGNYSQNTAVLVLSNKVSATWSKHELRPGSTEQRSEKVRITVKRESAVGDAVVGLSIDPPIRATVNPQQVTLPAGEAQKTFELTVTGHGPSAQERDIKLSAKVGGEDIVRPLPITVVQPKYWSSAAEGEGTADTNPVKGQPNAGLWPVTWQAAITFTVQDQFHKALGQNWAGALFWERSGGPDWHGVSVAEAATGTPLGSGATCQDIVTGTEWYNTEEEADQVIAGLGPTTHAAEFTFFIDYKVSDGGRDFLLEGINRRRQYRRVSNAMLWLDEHHEP